MLYYKRKPRSLASLVLLRLRYYVIARSVAHVALYIRTRISEHDRPSREYNDFWDHMKCSTRGQRVDPECFQYPFNTRSISFRKHRAKLSILKNFRY